MTVFSDQLPSVTGLPPNPQSVDIVHARLRDAILRGELGPGDEVRQERMAADLNVSRTPLREALRLLERENLVTSERNRSYRVTGFSLTDVEQIYVARVPLEALAIRLTIPRLETSDLASLEGALAQMATFAKAEDYEQWEVPHREFHRRVVSKAGDRLSRLLAELSDHAERYRRYYTTQVPRAWPAGIDEHRAILDACVERNPYAGGRRLAEHLSHTAMAVIHSIDPAQEALDLQFALQLAVTPVSQEAER